MNKFEYTDTYSLDWPYGGTYNINAFNFPWASSTDAFDPLKDKTVSDVFTATAWQDIFTLSWIPENPPAVTVIFENHSLNYISWYTISWSTITLTLDYPVSAWEILQVVYN